MYAWTLLIFVFVFFLNAPPAIAGGYGGIGIDTSKLAGQKGRLKEGEKPELEFTNSEFQYLSHENWQAAAYAWARSAMRRFNRIVTSGGQTRTLENFQKSVFDRITQPGDRQKLVVHNEGKMGVHAAFYPHDGHLEFGVGLLNYTPDVDSYAYIMAHETAHENKRALQKMLAAHDVDSVLEGVNGYQSLDDEQREEIRADLGATERLIQGGYNPWAAYHMQRMVSIEFDGSKGADRTLDWIFDGHGRFKGSHPLSEIRMAAIKAYILHRGFTKDLAYTKNGYTKFPKGVAQIKARVELYGAALHKHALRNTLGFAAAYLTMEAMGLRSGDILEATYDMVRHAISTDLSMEHIGRAAGEAIRIPLIAAKAYGWLIGGTLGGILGVHVLHQVSSIPGRLVKGALNGDLKDFSHYVKAALHDSAVARAIHAKQYTKSEVPEEIRRAYNDIILLDSMAHESDTFGDGRYSMGLQRWLTGFTLVQSATKQRYIRRVGAAADVMEKLPQNERAEFLNQITKAMGDFSPAIHINEYHRKANIMQPIMFIPEFQNHLHRLYAAASPEILTRVDPLESPLAQIANLTYRAKHVTNRTSRQEVFELIDSLGRRGLFPEAHKVMRAQFARLFDEVFSLDNPNHREATQLRQAFNQAAVGDGVGGQSWDEYLTTWLRQIPETQDEKQLAAFAFSEEAGIFGDLHRKKRIRSARSARRKIQTLFSEKVHSLRDLLHYLDTQIKPRHAYMHNLPPLLHGAIVNHPEWIRSPEDIEVLLAEKAFWPTYQGERNEANKTEALILDAMRNQRHNVPEYWSYNPGASESAQRLILNKMKQFGIYPSDYEGRVELWKRLTERGVTAVTDAIYKDLYEEASPEQKIALQNESANHRIWAQNLRGQAVEDRLHRMEEYKKLVAGDIPHNRRGPFLRSLVRSVQDAFPERGFEYQRILENLSTAINSSKEEAEFIQEAKAYANVKDQDFAVRAVSQLASEGLQWKHKDQWDLIRFLRGDIEATPKIRSAFGRVGVERIRNIFQILPNEMRTLVVDQFLDSPRGLLKRFSITKGYGKQIVDHALAGLSPKADEVARQLLEAYFYALDKTGNGPQKTYVLSYLMARHEFQRGSSSNALKEILEMFGATGVKIGQFLAASGLLSPEETKALLTLQDRARLPIRANMYEDLEKELGADLSKWVIEKLLGGGSMKYVVKATNTETGSLKAAKVTREDAVIHTKAEFDQLDMMSDYLVKRFGSRFWVLKSIVKATRGAVARELDIKNEERQTQIARERLEKDKHAPEVKVVVPQESIVSPRVMMSDLLEGKTFFQLPESDRFLVAPELLKVLNRDLFPSEERHLNPDSHGGNTLSKVEATEGKLHIQIGLIDWGQQMQISPERQQAAVDLFSVAQIMARTGATNWGLSTVERIVGHPLPRHTARYVNEVFARGTEHSPFAAYYSLIGALDAAGAKTDSFFLDYGRMIAQADQFEPYLIDKSILPSRILHGQVTRRVSEFVPAMKLQLKPLESVRAGLRTEGFASTARQLSKACAKAMFSLYGSLH